MTDEEWAFVEPFVIETGPRDYRLVLDGVFWIARTGAAWRELHSHFGAWNSVYRQFRRWTHAGLWDVKLEAMNETGAGDDSVQMIDSTSTPPTRLKRGCGPGSWPLARWLLDQNPSPLRRSRPPCRGLSERRSGLGCEGLCAGDGPARSQAPRPARRQGLRRRLHPGRPGGQRRLRRHSGQAEPQGPARHRRLHLRPQKPGRAMLLKA